MTTATINITCDITKTEKKTKLGKNGQPNLPRGWKRWNDKVYSAEAWKDQYVMRCFYLPILKPADGDWKDLGDELHRSWSKSTEATRWAYKQLLMNDIVRDDSMDKIPKMPPIYLYGLGNWEGWSQSANCVLQLAEQQYRARRYDIVWRGNSNLPNAKFPQPWLMHETSVNISYDDSNMFVDVRLYSGRQTLILKTHQHKRAANVLKQVADGTLKHGEAKVYKGKKGDVMFAVSVWVPVRQRRVKTGTLFVKTDPESFLVALNEKDDKLWIINGDAARRTVVKRDRAQNRFRDDLKFERRPMTAIEKQEQKRISVKQQNRLESFVKQSAAQVVGYALRRKMKRIVYDGHDKSYFKKFPWHMFENCLKSACQREGVMLEQKA